MLCWNVCELIYGAKKKDGTYEGNDQNICIRLLVNAFSTNELSLIQIDFLG